MTIVHIDNAPADVNKRYQPAVEVVGDISESLYEILRCAHRTQGAGVCPCTPPDHGGGTRPDGR